MDDLLMRVKTILVTTPFRWNNLSIYIPHDQLRESPAPGEWSAAECLQHMIDVEHLYQSRLHAFLEGRDFPAFNPDSEGTRDNHREPDSLASEFSHLREQTLRELEPLTPADYERVVRHAELGKVSLGQMLCAWAAHDLNHTIQAERALMQPFIRECGPWRVFFTDHTIAADAKQ